MENRIKRHRDRRQRMISFFSQPANKTIIATQADVVADIQTFKTESAVWEALAVEIETLEANDNAAAKKGALKAMAEGVTRWGQRCLVKLRRLGLMNEAKLADHQPSDFYGMPNSEAIDLAKAMRNMLQANLTALSGQGVTAAVIADLDAKIATADTLDTKPMAAIKELETKRAGLTTGDAALELQLEDIVNTLHAEFRYTDVDFDRALMTQYELGGDTSKRYTGIEGMVTSAQGPLGGYLVRRADDPEKLGMVDPMTGAYSIKGMRSGEVAFDLVDPSGVVKATKMLRLKLGTVVIWDWVVG